ncbi:hypothetical protein [Phreatobacter stygius]|uniref:UrcA family protein n=1 Tax=Phreatobacter stygius TaxID=1940610 RepID=A0A4D7APR7_9HYPH|nr:hypothetical protein [Phreatobacter stygius]QCI62979.1 hypothetical protein E8M01_01200 [Phreatobacter stygius]
MHLKTLAFVLAAVMPGLAAASPSEAFCARDLSATDTRLRHALIRLNETRDLPMSQRCNVIRDHLRALTQAASVHERCSTGRARAENVGQMVGSITDWREVIARNCP